MIRGSKSIGTLNTMLRRKKASRVKRIKLYRTVITLVVMYRCEMRVLTKKNEISV